MSYQGVVETSSPLLCEPRRWRHTHRGARASQRKEIDMWNLAGGLLGSMLSGSHGGGSSSGGAGGADGAGGGDLSGFIGNALSMGQGAVGQGADAANASMGQIQQSAAMTMKFQTEMALIQLMVKMN